MERDGTGQLSTIYTYGNQRINSESYNNLSGLYTYDGRGSVSGKLGTGLHISDIFKTQNLWKKS